MRPLFLALVLLVSSAVHVLANDEQDCFQGKVPQLRIKGCSEIIQRAPDDATAYHNRATAQPEKMAPKPPKIGAITAKSPKTAATPNPPKTKAIPQANTGTGNETSGDAWPAWAPK